MMREIGEVARGAIQEDDLLLFNQTLSSRQIRLQVVFHEDDCGAVRRAKMDYDPALNEAGL